MPISSITTSVISSLGNNSGSILPLFAKDALNSAGVAYVFSKKGGKQEGKEKVIEEFGTQGIWLLGIPLVKKIFDKTVYKIAGIDAGIDIRKFKGEYADNIDDTIKRIADSPQKKALNHALNNKALAKGLFISKFAVATLATMGALHALISYKQKTTKNELKAQFYEQEFLSYKLSMATSSFKVLVLNKPAAKETSFKGAGQFLSSFMYNPVRNMSLLDGGIFAKRMELARKGEKGEVAFREISTIGFLYVLAKPIQKGLEFLGEKITKLPLGLDYKLLASDDFQKSLADGSLKESLGKFAKTMSNDSKMIDYIYKNPDNKVVQMLKTSGDIKTVKTHGEKLWGIIPRKIATQEIDSLAFIDTDNVKSVVKNIQKMSDKVSAGGALIPTILQKAKGAKTAAIFTNIAVAVAFLAVIQPLLIIQARKANNNGDSKNPAIRAEEEEIRSTFA